MWVDWKRFRSTMMIGLKSWSVKKANARCTAVEQRCLLGSPAARVGKVIHAVRTGVVRDLSRGALSRAPCNFRTTTTCVCR